MLSSQSKKMAPEIPSDLLIGILKRLPVKSLARFKCVSKLWFSLITSQGYLFASPLRLYLSSLVEKKFELLSFSLASTSKSSTVFDLDLTKQGIGGYHMVALHGLILYLDGQICIFNPTTGQRVTLPAIKFNTLAEKGDIEQINYFLGYDPVLDQYKVVYTAVAWSFKLPSRIYAQLWGVFVLEAGSSWKRIEFDHPHFPMRQKVFINGVIYYLATSVVSGCILVSFDFRSEEFNMIQVPSVVNKYMTHNVELIEYGGKPTIFDYTHLWYSSGLVNLWVLEDAGIWSSKSLVLKHCQMHLDLNKIQFKVIGTTQNGEFFLQPLQRSSPYYIIYYDLHRNVVREVDIKGIPEAPLHFAVMDACENIMHLKM